MIVKLSQSILLYIISQWSILRLLIPSLSVEIDYISEHSLNLQTLSRGDGDVLEVEE